MVVVTYSMVLHSLCPWLLWRKFGYRQLFITDSSLKAKVIIMVFRLFCGEKCQWIRKQRWQIRQMSALAWALYYTTYYPVQIAQSLVTDRENCYSWILIAAPTTNTTINRIDHCSARITIIPLGKEVNGLQLRNRFLKTFLLCKQYY